MADAYETTTLMDALNDMAILYAIKTRSGVHGTLADAYGTYSDPSVGAFLDDVAFAGRTPA
jgi:hypothetical protein